MAFDAEGNYSPPDAATRHVLVVTKAHDGFLGQGRFPIAVPAGQVLAVAMLGQTNVPGHGVQYRNPNAAAVWIEHATAEPKHVLTEAEFAPLVAAAEKKQAAVQAFWTAMKAKAEAAKAAPAHSPLENPAPVG